MDNETNDWLDDAADMQGAHRVEVAWIAYAEDGAVLFNSDDMLTGEQAAAMFRGIAAHEEN